MISEFSSKKEKINGLLGINTGQGNEKNQTGPAHNSSRHRNETKRTPGETEKGNDLVFKYLEGSPQVFPLSARKDLSLGEAQVFLDESRKDLHPLCYHWAIALLTGMRPEEINTLRWSDIDMKGRAMTIGSSHSHRGVSDIRVLPISENLKIIFDELKVLWVSLKEAAGHETGTGPSSDNLVLLPVEEFSEERRSVSTRNFCSRIGITPVTFCGLRQTFITNLISQGVSEHVVMGLVGKRVGKSGRPIALSEKKASEAINSLGYKIQEMPGMKEIGEEWDLDFLNPRPRYSCL